jgi:sulfur-carrier protein
MKIEVKLFATLARFMPDKDIQKFWIFDIEENTSIDDLLKKKNIPLDEIKMIFLNGVHAKGSEILKDKDRVGIFPPIGGG